MSKGQPGNDKSEASCLSLNTLLVGPVEHTSLLSAKPLVVTENEELSLWLEVGLQL